tara:strand:- start:449 stop:811 length:363 start_codon:yes stop_codon:yes gene_type:complete
MVYNYGCDGTLSLHYKGIICSTFPLTKIKTLDYYIKQGEASIFRHFKMGHNIKKQIELCTVYCEVFTSRRFNKSKVAKQDHDIFLQAVMMLLKTKQFNNDDNFGWFVMPYKPIKRKQVLV